MMINENIFFIVNFVCLVFMEYFCLVELIFIWILIDVVIFLGLIVIFVIVCLFIIFLNIFVVYVVKIRKIL